MSNLNIGLEISSLFEELQEVGKKNGFFIEYIEGSVQQNDSTFEQKRPFKIGCPLSQ